MIDPLILFIGVIPGPADKELALEDGRQRDEVLRRAQGLVRQQGAGRVPAGLGHRLEAVEHFGHVQGQPARGQPGERLALGVDELAKRGVVPLA